MGFRGGFEGREGGGIPDASGGCIPEGWSCHRPRSGAWSSWDMEEAGIAGPEGTGWDIPEQLGCQYLIPL